MAKPVLTDCDKMVRKALMMHGAQTSKGLRAYSNRVFGEDYTVHAIGAALRKLANQSYVAFSPNEKGQNVYWLTEKGKAAVREEM